MRRPVMYLAGLLLATGAGIALSAPAQAAPAHNAHGTAVSDWPFGGDDYYSYDLDYDYNSYDLDQRVNSCNANSVGITLINWVC